MPDEDREYVKTEIPNYEPAPCQSCGGKQTLDWVRSNTGSSGEPLYLPGLSTCSNSDCIRNGGGE